MTVCFSDIETREAMRRLKEVASTFGFSTNGENLSDTLGSYSYYSADIARDVQVLQEFLALLRKREDKREEWGRKSPQIEYRKPLVDFMMKICAFEKLTVETNYQAIYLVDRFMDQHDISPVQLGVIALVCISVSGKLLESDNRTPKYRHLVRNLKGPCQSNVKHAVELEKYVLDAFNFDILIPTEINFLKVYLLYAVDGLHAVAVEDDNNNINRHGDENNNDSGIPNGYHPDHSVEEGELENSFQETTIRPLVPFNSVPGTEKLNAMNESALLILQELAQGEPTNAYKPSLVAAAILLASRREHGLNFWTITLERVSSYNLNQVYQCLKNYVEPILPKLNFKEPFIHPHFVDIVFEPYLVIPESSEGSVSSEGDVTF